MGVTAKVQGDLSEESELLAETIRVVYFRLLDGFALGPRAASLSKLASHSV